MTKKRPRRSAVSKIRQNLILRGQLRESRNALLSLASLRRSAPVGSYKDIIDLINSDEALKERLSLHDYSTTFNDLESLHLLDILPADREFRWAGARLAPHTSKLAHFIKLSLEFQRRFLKADYDSCWHTLKEIGDEFGQSLWLIKATIPLIQFSVNLEAHKRYTNKIFRETNYTGITPYITFFVSMRNEPAVTPSRFLFYLEEQLSTQDLSPDIEAIFRFHAHPKGELTREEIALILNYASAGNIIDLYETTIKLAQLAISSGFKDLYSSIVPVFRSLHPVIDDHRIEMLLLELEHSYISSVAPTINELHPLELFLRGSYKEAEKAALKNLTETPDNFNLVELAARSAAILSGASTNHEPEFLRQLIRRMAAVIRKESPIGEDISELVKVSLNFNVFSWATSLINFVRTEISPNPLEYSSFLSHLSALDSNYISPLRIPAIPSVPIRQKYAELITKGYPNNLVANLNGILVSNNLQHDDLADMCWEEGVLIRAETSLRLSETTIALEAATELATSASEYYRQKAARLGAHCLLLLGRLDDCLELISSKYIANQRLHHVLPIELIVNTIEKLIVSSERDRPSSAISLPIVYDIYARHISNNYDAERSYAYEDFLTLKGIERPSQIKAILNELDIEKVIYFLRYICVEPVMHRSRAFTRSIEITEERIAVCRILIELDPAHQEDYENEIREIVQQLTIQKRIQQIEQSKIYIDTTSLRAAADKKLRESFNRYISFRKEGLDEQLLLIKRVLDQINSKKQQALIFLDFPENEMEDVFNNLIKDLRDEFVSSPEHGLDKYLSVRIRHGTLSGELRKPLETYNLITQRDHKTEKYKPNEYWGSRLTNASGLINKKIAERLAQFSAEFDQFVKYILSDWVQIKKEPKGKGLFDFSLTDADLKELSINVTPDTTFEQFLEGVFELFNSKLENSLKTIRASIDTEAKETVNRMLTSLRNDLEHYAYGSYGNFYTDLTDLSNSILAARTGMQNALNRVADWFKLSKSDLNEPFYAEEAVEISRDTLIRISSERFNVITSTVNGENRLSLPGRHLSNLVDIFINVFQNIIKHSDTEDAPLGEVTITYQKDIVRFRIENAVERAVASKAAKSKIRTIKDAMEKSAHSRLVTREGGTGFHKIRRIIYDDFKDASPILDFGFINNSRFFVDFSIRIERLYS